MNQLKSRTMIVATVAAVSAGAVALAGVTVAAAGDDDEAPITGAALTRATAAALAHVGEGRVSETEVGDEDSFYEVEVTLDDGRQVDVQLDDAFEIVSSSADRDGEGDDD